MLRHWGAGWVKDQKYSFQISILEKLQEILIYAFLERFTKKEGRNFFKSKVSVFQVKYKFISIHEIFTLKSGYNLLWWLVCAICWINGIKIYHIALSFHVKVFALSILRTFTMGTTISLGQRSLASYSPRSQKKLDMIEYNWATEHSTYNLTMACGDSESRRTPC